MTPRRARPAHDEGIATVWAAAGAAVIMATLLLGLHLGAAVAARHRAEAAADLAALAAAGQAVHGAGTACRRAEVIAQRMGGEVIRCLLSGWDALVEVHIPVPLARGGAEAVGRARAGPVAPEPLPASSPAGHGCAHRPPPRRPPAASPALPPPSATLAVLAAPGTSGPALHASAPANPDHG